MLSLVVELAAHHTPLRGAVAHLRLQKYWFAASDGNLTTVKGTSTVGNLNGRENIRRTRIAQALWGLKYTSETNTRYAQHHQSSTAAQQYVVHEIIIVHSARIRKN